MTSTPDPPIPLTSEVLSGLRSRAEVRDADGQRLGHLQHIYDDESGAPAWVTVEATDSDRPARIVPLQGARLDGPDLRLGYRSGVIDGSPDVDADQVIDSTTEERLRAHYGLDSAAGDRPDALLTLSEERMAVRTRVQAAERVLIHKYIVTEEVTQTFTVRREEIRVEHRLLDGSESATVPPGTAFVDDVKEIVLHAEVPVIQVVPVEIVRVTKHTVTGRETVSADLAREQLDLDQTGDHEPPRDT